MKTSEAILIDSLAILEVSMEGVLPPWSKDELVLTDSRLEKLGLADTCSIDEFEKLFPILDVALGVILCG